MRKLFIIFIITAVLISCTYYTPFRLVNEEYRFQKGNLIILPGQYAKIELELVELLSSGQKDLKLIRIQDYQDYKHKLNISLSVEGPYEYYSPFQEASVDFNKFDYDQIKSIFKQFEPEYIFFIWCPYFLESAEYPDYNKSDFVSDAYYEIQVVGMLFSKAQPDKEIGQTHIKEKIKAYSVLYGRKESNDIRQLLKKVTDQIKERLAEYIQ